MSELEREFRGIDEKSKEFIYGQLIRVSTDPQKTDASKFVWGIQVCSESKFEYVSIVIPESIGQYTGLKDKNGVKIYGGDIYEVAKNRQYVVEFSSGVTSNFEWYGGCFILKFDEETQFPFDEFAMQNGEVIGNIHQNPELI